MHPFPRRWAVSYGALSGLPSFMRTLSCPLGGQRTAFLLLFSLFCFVLFFSFFLVPRLCDVSVCPISFSDFPFTLKRGGGSL